jgi:hypothetical protein
VHHTVGDVPQIAVGAVADLDQQVQRPRPVDMMQRQHHPTADAIRRSRPNLPDRLSARPLQLADPAGEPLPMNQRNTVVDHQPDQRRIRRDGFIPIPNRRQRSR